jgi:predicted transcriptional regulator
MLSRTVVTTEALKELTSRLEVPAEREKAFAKIQEICRDCRSSSPIICKELCQVWNIKKEHLSTFTDQAEKPNITELLKLVQNSRRLKILEALVEEPHTLWELRELLKNGEHSLSPKRLLDNYIEPLIRTGLVDLKEEVYEATFKGKSLYNLLFKTEVARFPIYSSGHEERILRELLSGPKSYDELLRKIPSRSLYRSLKKLQENKLIVKENLSGRVFYFSTKRRPTRKLSQIEMKIFKALRMKTGMTVRNLSEKVGISVRQIYKYLRYLKYKRHVRKEKVSACYKLTEMGHNLTQSLNLAHNIFGIQPR